MKKKIIIIVGPTASGKTELSIKLAKAFNGEIINADSTQIFEGTDIATNKITKKEMLGIKHHLLSIKKIYESYSVADFQKDSRLIIDQILNKNKVPIVVGGTGLYISALLLKYSFIPYKHNVEFSDEYNHLNNQEIWNILNKKDSESAQKIHVNNRYRILRTLEIIKTSGQKKSKIIEHDKQFYYNEDDFIIIGLNPNRNQLYERINARVLALVENGLFEEIKTAYYNCQKRITQALQCIGGKEIIMYENNEINYDECIDLMQKNNRHYARRQFTWFKNQLKTCIWFNYYFQNFQDICKEIEEFLRTYLSK